MAQESKKLYGIPVLKSFVKSKQIHRFINKSGKLQFKNYHKIKKFVHENEDLGFSAGELYALNLLNQLYLDIIEYYEENNFSDCFDELKNQIKNSISKKDLEFLENELFKRYNLKKGRIENSSQLFSELILIWLDNNNESLHKYSKIFDYTEINSEHHFEKLMDEVDIFFSEHKEVKKGLNLLQFLNLPARLFPDSLQKQLEFIKDNWSEYLGDISEKLLRSEDYLKEEEKRFSPAGVNELEVPVFREEEPERFTRDEDWMPNLVLIAKNIHVWLEQLSRKYERWIRYFDDIPDEELKLLAKRGFTGIWFIGLWERSPISRKIKHLTGNVGAEASAYSVINYQPAAELGGWESLHKLKSRAKNYGIRLGVDMVPNHTGLDSDWIVEHPDWFLSVNEPPFPGYSFNGPNLSDREEIEVYLEDHYYDSSDAAVVFKLYHRLRDKVYYIYHGNDGTGLPWNDTAQLDYLNPEVREAVKNMILEIAHNFSIIRFDAAMTLAKRHIRRLWYPQPGEGGDIPSRSNFGMSRKKFNKIMPNEFWREVVDKVESEAPDTLLLAEAFWMMEGYFVRTLGMHRVYNSAFMNMLENEKNRNFKQLIFDVLQFNPGILKRFVNFMSNPDEETAIDQFGADDKYFGTCVLMSTLPGLPMFAHGQVEGLSEKYGMDFLKPRLAEKENQYLIHRHEKEISPLLRKRYQFSGVEKFFIFNFKTESGTVNDDVISYANNSAGEKSLVVFNNKFSDTDGFLKLGINYNRRKDDKSFFQDKFSISEILELNNENTAWITFIDKTTGNEYLRSVSELNNVGLRLELQAFQYHVFIDFKQISDGESRIWKKLFDHFGYGGVDSWDKEYRKIQLGPILEPGKAIINKGVLKTLYRIRQDETTTAEFVDEFKFRLHELDEAIIEFAEMPKPIKIAPHVKKSFSEFFKIPKFSFESEKKDYLLFIWIFISSINRLSQKIQGLNDFYEKYGINFLIEDFLQKEFSRYASKLQNMIDFFLHNLEISEHKYKNFTEFFKELLQKNSVSDLINVHTWKETYWFDKDLMEYLFNLSWYFYYKNYRTRFTEKLEKNIAQNFSLIEDSEYKYDKLINLLPGKTNGKKQKK
ncbi:MAG: hypothetical protein KGY74_02505 [Candidatus Cloacimonetes bacterium]|nr:hypothetical protein [Candidatus Cloacimonadota bacterium]